MEKFTYLFCAGVIAFLGVAILIAAISGAPGF